MLVDLNEIEVLKMMSFVAFAGVEALGRELDRGGIG